MMFVSVRSRYHLSEKARWQLCRWASLTLVQTIIDFGSSLDSSSSQARWSPVDQLISSPFDICSHHQGSFSGSAEQGPNGRDKAGEESLKQGFWAEARQWSSQDRNQQHLIPKVMIFCSAGRLGAGRESTKKWITQPRFFLLWFSILLSSSGHQTTKSYPSLSPMRECSRLPWGNLSGLNSMQCVFFKTLYALPTMVFVSGLTRPSLALKRLSQLNALQLVSIFLQPPPDVGSRWFKKYRVFFLTGTPLKI